MAIKILTLDGLTDSRLSELLAQLIETVPGVKSANIDFLSRKLTMDVEERNSTQTINAVKALIGKTFPQVTVSRTDVGEAAEKPRKPKRDGPYIERPPVREEKEEEKAPEPPKEKRVKKRRFDSVSARAGLSWVLFGVSAVLFVLYLVLPYGSFWRELAAVLALLVSAVAMFQLNPMNGTPELRALTVMTALCCGAEFLLGEPLSALIAMLCSQAGLTVTAHLSFRLERAAADCVGISPETVEQVTETGTARISLKQVQPGMQIVVQDGDVVPFNGVVRDGVTSVDRSLFGEEESLSLGPEDRVFCGDLNLKAPIVMTVTAPQEASTAKKLQNLLTDPRRRGTVLPRRWSAFLSVSLILLAAVVGLKLLWGQPVENWFSTVLFLFLAGAPCGSYAGAEAIRQGRLIRGIRQGLLLPGCRSFDALLPVDTVITGYTGILTENSYTVAALEPSDEYTENELLRYAAFAESESSHPIAKAILERYQEVYGKEIVPSDGIVMCEEVPGKGMRCMVERRLIFAGGEAMMQEIGVPVPENDTGKMCTYVALRGEYVGRILLDTPLRPGAEEFTDALREAGVYHTILMASCDGSVVKSAGEALGFEETYGELTEEQQANLVESLLSKAQGKRPALLYLGDDSNLSVLKLPCIRVLLGSHSLSSLLEAVDGAIPSGNPAKLADMLRLSRGASRAAVVGFFMSYALKWVLLGCAAFLPLPLYAAAAVNAAASLLLLAIASRKAGD